MLLHAYDYKELGAEESKVKTQRKLAIRVSEVHICEGRIMAPKSLNFTETTYTTGKHLTA